MKAIVIHPQPADRAQSLQTVAAMPKIRLIADSAIGRDVMPLFVPDMPVTWLCHLCVAVRINRLGKNIAKKFASRYIDAISVVAMIEPDSESPLAAELTGSGLMDILDSAVTTGQWVPCDISSISTIAVTVNEHQVAIHIKDLDIEQSLSDISRYATVKTGDMLILECTAITEPLEINTIIDCRIDGTEVLKLKVK